MWVQVFKWFWHIQTDLLLEETKLFITVQMSSDKWGCIYSAAMGLDHQDVLQLVSDPEDKFYPKL